jgi:UDP-N-acetylglucosamine 1-carboxyvinyltransferase
MDSFIINGGQKLSGSIAVSGAKNATLPILAATMLADGCFQLSNVPYLNDIKMMVFILRYLGARIELYDGIVEIDTAGINSWEAPYEMVSKMRASINVLGPLLARFGKAKVSLPGGCAIGPRPVDLHLKAMEALGAEVSVEHGYVIATAKRLKGAEITFEKVSVGATENALCAAVLAKGTSVLSNCAVEPEVTSLVDFLIAMGAQIEGRGTSTLTITGVPRLHPVDYRMIADRIEAGTFLIAGAITGSALTVTNCEPRHLTSLLEHLRLAGCTIETDADSMHIHPLEHITPINVITQPYPDFPTDLQAQFMALMTLAQGISVIEETIFPDRFMHVAELNRLDASIAMDKHVATITGVKTLSGAQVMATDLRASAALVLAGLAAQGETTISRIYHIDRGYDQIERKLQQIGAAIRRVKG